MKIRHLTTKKGRYYFEPSKSMRAHGYAREALGADRSKAIARVEQLNAEWDRIRSGETTSAEAQVEPGSVEWLMRRFVRDPVYYGDKSSATKDEIDYVFKSIIAMGWGDIAVASIERRHCRALYRQLRETGSDHKAQRIIKYLARLMSFAIDEGLRGDNPAIKLGVRSPTGRSTVWTSEQVEQAIEGCIANGRRSLALLIAIAYDTGQRPQDVRTALWRDREDEGLRFQQSKTGQRVWAALSPRTLAMLDQTDKSSVYIICYEGTQRPYADKDQLGKQWRKVRTALEMPSDLRLADLRRTAATEAADGGATEAELDAVHGWKPGSRVHATYIRPGQKASRNYAQKRRESELKSER